MDKNEAVAEAVEQQSENSIQETDDGNLLAEAVVRLFHSHFSDTLNTLSARFPHRPEDNSVNEAEFQGLRAKVLRSGNNKLRQLPEMFADFEVIKVRDTVVEQIDISTKVQIRNEKEEEEKEND